MPGTPRRRPILLLCTAVAVAVAGTAVTGAGDVGAAPADGFGNTVIHPEKMGIYAVPDLYYTDPARTDASLRKVHELLPNAWIRWDNETGHVNDPPSTVDSFLSRTDAAGIPTIIAACCVDGYDNWWARGGSQPPTTIRQIADGPYLDFAERMRREHPSVRYVETINEPDGVWFVANPDDVGDWRHYLDRLTAAAGGDTSRLMGPAAAYRDGAIFADTVARPEFQQISYHTYGGWRSLSDVPGKEGTWVTEYGSEVPDQVGLSPGFVLTDLRNAEQAGKLSGSIRMLFHVNLQRMVNAELTEGDHYGFSGQLRALAAYQALGDVSARAWLDPEHDDVMAADDGAGAFAALLYDGSGSPVAGRTRSVPGTSVAPGTPLYALTIRNAAGDAATCVPLGEQDQVTADIGAGSVTLTARAQDPLSAVLITTRDCATLAG